MTRHLDTLPTGYDSRSIAMEDSELVADFCNVCEQHDYDEDRSDATDLRAIWDTADIDLDAASWLVCAVEEPSRPVAVAVPSKRGSAHIDVHPDYRGQGLESGLVRAVVAAAVSWDLPQIKVETPAHSQLSTTLAAEGFAPAFESWSLGCSPHEVAEVDVPAPYRVVTCASVDGAQRSEYYRQMHTLIEDAFAHWPGRVRRDFSTWQSTFVEHDGADPANWQLAFDETDAVVGVAVVLDYGDCLWVNSLAVSPQHRGAGLGAALLSGAARAASRLGYPEIGLDTDSRTGAKDLYVRVGMQVTATDQAWVRKIETT